MINRCALRILKMRDVCSWNLIKQFALKRFVVVSGFATCSMVCRRYVVTISLSEVCSAEQY